jgi:FHS family L-fucose permease-like MFS transporter
VEVGLASIAVNFFLHQGVGPDRVASFFASLGSFGALVTRFFGPWTSVKIAGILLSLYWFGALIGRLLGAWILTKVKAGKLLGIFGFAAAASIAISMLTSGGVAIWALVLCGFFNSIMFPNIFTLGIAGLGPMTSKGSGLITTAIVGGAVIPYLLGKLIDLFVKLGDPASIQHGFILPVICYLYIAYYGAWGSKPTRTITA